MKVNICGIPHSVKEVPNHFDATAFSLGQINYGSCEILINKDLNEAIKSEVLCHEIIHGILYHLGYEEANDEKFVQQLGNAINQTFKVKENK